jgi:twinkle protein
MYYEKFGQLGIRLRRRSGQEKTTCPQCSESRRNKKDPCLSVNITEGTFNCHNCGWKGNVKAFERKESVKRYEKPSPEMLKSAELNERLVSYFGGRGISEGTLKKFFIHGREEFMPQTQKKERCVVFPYIRETEIVNAKYRDGAKNFKMTKDAELIFFGMQTLRGRHCAIITEGEVDALSAYEAGFGKDYDAICNEDGEVVEHEMGRWAVLSVPNGASRGNQRLDYLDNCSEWLAAVDEFIIAVDNDQPGRELRDELIRRLGVEKCRTVDWSILESHQTNGNGPKIAPKDLNEVLVHFGSEAVKSLLIASPQIPVDGIYYVDDLLPDMLKSFRGGVQLAPTTRFTEMDEYFRWKKGDINLVIGYANWGKSFFTLQMMLTKSIWDGWKWAVFSPENYPANDFYDDLVEMYAGKWLSDMNEDEYVAACKFIGDHIYFVYPDNDHDINSIHDKFRYLILKKGLDGVLIDPFNQLDHLQKAYQREDQYLSSILKDIKRFALLNQVVYNIIAHPKNPSYNQDRSLPVADMYDIAGGAMFGNKVDQIISYHRPRFHEDKNSPEVEVYIQKLKRKRTGGKLGNYSLTLNWKAKRFSNPITGETSCDPLAAKKIKLKAETDFVPQNMWTSETEIDF